MSFDTGACGCAVIRADVQAGGDTAAGDRCKETRGSEGVGPVRVGVISRPIALMFVGHDAPNELSYF